MTAEEMRKKFLARWIPYGVKLLARAEGNGVDWENCPMERLVGEIITAEEFATPDEYKSNPFPITKGSYHG